MKGPTSNSALDSILRAFLRETHAELRFLAAVIHNLCEETRIGLALKAKEKNYFFEYAKPDLIETYPFAPWVSPLFEHHGSWISGKPIEHVAEAMDVGTTAIEDTGTPTDLSWWVSFPIKNPVTEQAILWITVPKTSDISKLNLTLIAAGVESVENCLRTKETLGFLQNQMVWLQKENTYVESLMNAFPDLIFILDEKGTILNVRSGNNPDLIQPIASIKKQNIRDIPGLSSSTYDKFLQAVYAIQAGESHALFEYTTLKDHETQYFEANMAPFGESQFIAIVRNITEVKKIEADLFTSSKLFEQAGKLAKIGAWEYDCVKHTHHWSQVTREILGYDAHAPEPTVEVGMRLYEDEESFRLINASFRLAVEEGIPYDVELRLKTYKNETIWVRALGIPVMEDGICQRIFGTFQDISAIKKSQEELALKVEEFRALFENMGQGVVYHDQTGAIIRANSAAQDILGLNLETLLNSSSIDPRWHIITEDGVPIPGEQHPAMCALKTGERVKEQVLGVYIPDERRYRWILVDATPEFLSGEETPHRVFSTFTDISELKHFEQKLEEKRVHLLSIMESAADGIWAIDKDMKLTYANEVFKIDFFKFVGAEIKEGEALLPLMPEAGKLFWATHYERGLRGERFTFEFNATFTNGEKRVYKVNCNPILMKEEVIGLALFASDKTRERLYTQAIEQQNRQLRDISWSQSHLVREPLTKILSICQLIKDTGFETLEELELIPELLHASEEMDQVIQKIIREANHSKK